MVTHKTEPIEALENEWYAVRHSGELPEIALHSSFYYLMEDDNGPGLDLAPDQYRLLVEAAELRYREIVLRDLNHIHRETGMYRGVRRSIANWARFEEFCRRQRLDCIGFRPEVAAALQVFLAQEVVDVERGKRQSSINCTFAELSGFAKKLGLVSSVLPANIKALCRE